MFAPISAIFALLVFAPALANGIRVVEFPDQGESVEILAGYDAPGLTDFASAPGAKALLIDAYASGGTIAFVNDAERSALRVTAPRWALPALLGHIPGLFSNVPVSQPVLRRAAPDFRSSVEREIDDALLGPVLIRTPYATGDAFVLVSATVPESLRTELSAIPRRGSAETSDSPPPRLNAERILRFKSDLPEGAVIFASETAGVYYKQWYALLLLDRLIVHAVPLSLSLKTSLPLTVRPGYYRLETAVPAGQLPEPVEESLLQELQRLQFVPVEARALAAAKQEVRDYLSQKSVREWFASHDMGERLEEGTRWVEGMASDDMRAAARDMLAANRVLASWAPKPRQTTVSTESLSTALTRPAAAGAVPAAFPDNAARAPFAAAPFSPHTDVPRQFPVPERLASGVSLVESTVNAVFVSGATLMRLDRDPTGETVKAFQQYRPERILVLAPAAKLQDSRRLWSTFKGSATGETGVPKGKVSSGDLSALFVIETFVNLKLLESGLWPASAAAIDASEGAELQIRAGADVRAALLNQIHAIALGSLPESEFAWMREVAVHRFDAERPDVQALMWEHDPLGTVQDPGTVSLSLVQDVARIYF